ncbi:MAG: transketolase [Lachnospiraceae bacterium]|nr:transketolase [Lachnospiraceae bacterium]MCD8362443.1 transketolase [Lachnospiraceae bacterium]
MSYSKELLESLEAKAKLLRKDCMKCIGVGVAGHVGGSCSSADLVAALYFYKMKYDPKNPDWEGRDYFLLSKGHVAILQYSALAEAGFFPVEDLQHCKDVGFYLQGHPHLGTPGIEAGTGSLGQGLSLGLGMAIGLKMDDKPNNVYVLVGDGEQNEGQIWEAAMAAGAKKMDNLCAIIDNNGLQAMGKIKDRLDSGNLAEKWAAFGWNVIEIDGHNMEEIVKALDDADEYKGKPTAIIAHTVKGKGVSFAENQVGFHNAALTKEQYEQALAELS